VITTMIGQHPELAGLPELKLFSCSKIADLIEPLPSHWVERGVRHRSPGLVRAVAQLQFGEQSVVSIPQAVQWLRERAHWSGEDVFDTLQERLSPRVAVEKSPENVLDDDDLDRMASAYPRARYLHLTRHPVTTQRSMQAYRARTWQTDWQADEPMAGIRSWCEIHQRIIDFAAGLPIQRYFRVRAEDVLNDPDPKLRSIALWLKVRVDEDAISAMKNPEASPFASPGTADGGTFGGNDPEFLSDPKPHQVEIPSTLQPPTGWSAEPTVWRSVVQLSNQLGYFES